MNKQKWPKLHWKLIYNQIICSDCDKQKSHMLWLWLLAKVLQITLKKQRSPDCVNINSFKLLFPGKTTIQECGFLGLCSSFKEIISNTQYSRVSELKEE